MERIFELFFRFLQIGVMSFGGGYAVLPFIQAEIVDGEHWLTVQEFTDIITISQMTPGPLAVNSSTFVGMRVGGIFGAVAATVGCILAGCCISLFLCRLFRRYQKAAGIIQILRGLRAASVGLIASAAASILSLALFSQTSDGGWLIRIPSAIVFLASLILLRKWKLNPMLVMGLSGLAGILFSAFA